MARRGPGVWLVALGFLCAAGSAAAQSSSHLSGFILDPAEAAVPAANITVVDQDTGFRRIVNSSNEGAYLVASLRPGTYKITVSKDGFRTRVQLGVKVNVGEPSRLDFHLELGSVQEVITVEGAPPLLNTEDSAVSTLVDQDRIQRLPVNGRGILSLLELAPGTVATPATRGEAGQFTVNGQRPNTHYFTLDGVSANTGVGGGGGPLQLTGGSLPGMTAIGSFHGIASLDSLQEFRVQTATSAPEFGRMPGAQVVLSSRTGSNDWQASLAWYFRHNRLDANDWFANRARQGRGNLRLDDLAATLGGPLKRDRTFFFLTYEGIRLQQPFAWRTPVPTEAAREIPTGWPSRVISLFPLPNGGPLGPNLAEWTARNQRPSRLNVASARLDQAIGSRANVFARYTLAPSHSEFGDTQVGSLSMRSHSVTTGGTVRLRPGLALDARYNWSTASASSFWRPSTVSLPACYFDTVARGLGRQEQCDYLARFSIAGVGQVISGPESDRRQTQDNLAVVGLFAAGPHQIRAGADIRRLTPWRKDRAPTLSVIAETLSDFLTNTGLWVASAQPIEATTTLSEMSYFLQDTWRVAPRLTATLGMRWELLPEPTRTDPALQPFRDSGLWSRSYTDLAPRAGIAFRPTAAGRTVIRAGGGMYFNSSLAIATDLVNGGPFSLGQYTNNRSLFVATVLGYAFDENLRSPWVKQWSALIEHATEGRNVFSAGYSGSRGQSLLRREIGGPNNTERLQLVVATNHGISDYHALDLQYRGRIGSRLTVISSYAWAHSIDNSSSDGAIYWTSPAWGARNDRGDSDFDVRQTVTAAVTYETPQRGSRAWWQRLAGGWQTDGIFRARTGFPIAIANSETATGLTYANAFRPNLVWGVPQWIEDRGAPGGRRLNRDAFVSAPLILPAGTPVQGNLGRNAVRGFGMTQFDVALRREFRIRGGSDKGRLLFGAEAFNVFNRASFADPVRYLSSPLFGQSPSMLNLMLGTGTPGSGLAPVFQNGGPRSLQLMLRLRF